MPDREALKTGLELIVTWIVVFGVALAIPDQDLPLNYKVLIGSISAICLTIYAAVFFNQKPNAEIEKLAAYSPIHAMIVRLNSEVPPEKALQAQNIVGYRLSASLIDFRNISAVFHQHNDKFRAKDLKMWIGIEEEIKIDNHFWLSNDRQMWFNELEAEYNRLKKHNKTHRE